jgi:uncharacterized membrane-anchored protein
MLVVPCQPTKSFREFLKQPRSELLLHLTLQKEETVSEYEEQLLTYLINSRWQPTRGEVLRGHRSVLLKVTKDSDSDRMTVITKCISESDILRLMLYEIESEFADII